jgi:hypothetical protein
MSTLEVPLVGGRVDNFSFSAYLLVQVLTVAAHNVVRPTSRRGDAFR